MKSAVYSRELVVVIFPSSDSHRALCAAKRHVDESTLVRHQRSERRDFILIDVRCVANAALRWKAMHTVLRPPSVNDFDRSVIAFQGELHPVHRVAGFDLVENSGGQIEARGGLVEVAIDLRKEGNVLSH